MIDIRTAEPERRIIILKTDIQSVDKIAELRPVFDNHVGIKKWSIDLEDIDKVLRIEVIPLLTKQDILELMYSCGFQGDEL